MDNTSLVLCWFLVAIVTTSSSFNKRPIIGILTQECEESDQSCANHTSYLSATYVKAVESSGARVVPIVIRKDMSYYINLMKNINGVVFPGGSSVFDKGNGIGKSGTIVYEIAKQMAAEGDPVPILGVCQGLELLTFITNSAQNPLTSCPYYENVELSLQFKPGYAYSSLYELASKEDIMTLSNLPSTSNHHRWCLTEKNLTRTGLDKLWKVLSTSRASEETLEFISSMEMKSMPVAAVQFHPEKTAFDWTKGLANAHSRLAISASRLFYDWLIDHARKSSHKFINSDEENDALIYNYSPIFTGKIPRSSNTQTYYF